MSHGNLLMAARGDFTFSEALSGQDFTATIYLVRDPHYQRPAKYVPRETFLCPLLRFLSEWSLTFHWVWGNSFTARPRFSFVTPLWICRFWFPYWFRMYRNSFLLFNGLWLDSLSRSWREYSLCRGATYVSDFMVMVDMANFSTSRKILSSLIHLFGSCDHSNHGGCE